MRHVWAILGLVAGVAVAAAATAAAPAPSPAAACLDPGGKSPAEDRVKACNLAVKAAWSGAPDARGALLVARARALNDVSRFAEAEADADAALSIRQDDLAARLARGEARSMMDRNDAAFKDLEIVLKGEPRNAVALWRRGQIWHYNKSAPDKARADYDAALTADPRLMMAWHDRGMLRLDAKDFTGGLADLDAALKLQPDSILAARDRGVALEDLDRRAEAIVAYSAILKANPDNAATYTYRGSARFDAGDLKGALADFDAAIAHDPDQQRAYRLKSELLDKQGHVDQAIAAAEAGLKRKADDVDLLSDVADLYKRAGKFDLALARLDAAIKAEPKNADHLVERAKTLEAKGDKPAAKAALDSAVSLDPKSTYALNNRGLYFYRGDDDTAAIADFSAAIAVDPKYDPAYFNLGLAYMDLKRYDRAVRAYNDYLKLLPGDADALTDKGECYRLLGDDLRAIEQFDAAIAAKVDLALAWWRRGLAKESSGDAAGARADKAQARKLDPHVGQ